ncbi:unnamed protein product [Dovyalis caffra]|uniref:Gnk2-homologous domain-containing protein n=1 Tax=Dovyalis caffra TaxID=77055 RepID=A0AAV1S5G1_9ROSI|nr:unnamed protein product [Dovyalis caffra]
MTWNFGRRNYGENNGKGKRLILGNGKEREKCYGFPVLETTRFVFAKQILKRHNRVTQLEYWSWKENDKKVWEEFPIPHSAPITTNTKANLNLLLSSLSSNVTRNNINGFYNVSAGQDPDAVYGMFLCRGDVRNSVCRSCVNFATKDVLGRCPNEKVAVIWFDECELRYSNRNIFSTVDQDLTLIMSSPNNVTVQPERFNQLVATTINDIASRAAAAPSGARKFAVQQANYTGEQKLYTLVQCTPDLPSSGCSRCLEDAISILRNCCDRRQGGRVIFASCNFRYELYELYNATAAAEASPPPPPPPPAALTPPPASGSGERPKAQNLPPARYDGFVYENRQGDLDSILIEAFYDPVCPDSSDSWPPLKEALKHYGSCVWLIVHLLPLPYHDNAFVTSRALHIANALNSSFTFPLLEQFFKHQEKFYNSKTSNLSKVAILKEVVKFATVVVGNSYSSAFESGFNDRQTDLKTRVSFKVR